MGEMAGAVGIVVFISAEIGSSLTTALVSSPLVSFPLEFMYAKIAATTIETATIATITPQVVVWKLSRTMRLRLKSETFIA